MRHRLSVGLVLSSAIALVSCSHGPSDSDAPLATFTHSFPATIHSANTYRFTVDLTGVSGIAPGDAELALGIGFPFTNWGAISFDADSAFPIWSPQPVHALTPPTPAIYVRRHAFGPGTHIGAELAVTTSSSLQSEQYVFPVTLTVRSSQGYRAQQWSVRTVMFP